MQASELHTLKIFEELQEKYEEYRGPFIKEHSSRALTHKYIVVIFRQQEEHRVTATAYAWEI